MTSRALQFLMITVLNFRLTVKVALTATVLVDFYGDPMVKVIAPANNS
jgi:hypothetical protein